MGLRAQGVAQWHLIVFSQLLLLLLESLEAKRNDHVKPGWRITSAEERNQDGGYYVRRSFIFL